MARVTDGAKKAMESAQTRGGQAYAQMVRSFILHLKAENRSANTVKAYTRALDRFYDFLAERNMPTEPHLITREHVQEFMSDVLSGKHRQTGNPLKPSFAAYLYGVLHVWFGWLLEEGEITANPMERMKPPKFTVTPPDVLTENDLKRMLKACEGKDFLSRRNHAALRLLIDTGIRRSELLGMQLDHINWDVCEVWVMGKGNKPRHCPFGRKTAQALDRYIRVRAGHPHADSPFVWLGPQGPLKGGALYHAVRQVAKKAGIGKVWVHLFRHTYAHRFLAEGGGETSLMRLAGWQSRSMLQRYGASAADERAKQEYRRLSLGDRL